MEYKAHISKTILDNGLTVVSVNHPSSIALVSLNVFAGSNHEIDVESGTAHFLEHMLFKGSKNAPTTFELASQLEQFGGNANAYTSNTRTTYYTEVPVEHLNSTYDVLSDMLANPILDPAEIESERQVILEEEAQGKDTPDYRAYYNIMARCFEGQTCSRPVIGTSETISRISRTDLTTFMDHYYQPSNMVVFVSGAIDHDKLVEYVKSSHWGTHKTTTQGRVPGEFVYTVSGCQEIMDRSSASGLILFKYEKDDFLKARMLGMLLGRGLTAPLFTEVRERRGLAYYISSGTVTKHDCFAVRFASTPSNVEKTIRATKEVIDRFDEHIDEFNWNKNQNVLKMGFDKIVRYPSMQLEKIMFLHERGKLDVSSFSEVYQDEMNLTLKEVIEFGRRLFSNSPSISIAGNVQENIIKDIW